MTNSLRKIVNKVFNAHKSPGDMDRKCMHSALKTIKTYLSNGGDIYQWAVRKWVFICTYWKLFSALSGFFQHCSTLSTVYKDVQLYSTNTEFRGSASFTVAEESRYKLHLVVPLYTLLTDALHSVSASQELEMKITLGLHPRDSLMVKHLPWHNYFNTIQITIWVPKFCFWVPT